MADQRGGIKTLALSRKTEAEAYEYETIKSACGDHAFTKQHVHQLFKQFQNGKKSIQSGIGKCQKPALLMHSPEKVALIHSFVDADQRMTVQGLATESGLSGGGGALYTGFFMRIWRFKRSLPNGYCAFFQMATRNI